MDYLQEGLRAIAMCKRERDQGSALYAELKWAAVGDEIERLRDENEALKDLIAGAADELGDFPPSKRWVDQFVKRAEAALAAKGE